MQKVCITVSEEAAKVFPNNAPPHRHGSETRLDEGGGEAPSENPEDSSLLSAPTQETSNQDASVKIELIGHMNQVDYNQRTPLHNAATTGISLL
jgi:hypothetical protein